MSEKCLTYPLGYDRNVRPDILVIVKHFMDNEQFENLIKKHLKRLYGLDVINIKKLRGFYDLNFYVKANLGEFFVKIYGKDKLPNIKFQIEFAKNLKQKGFTVAEVIQNNKGKEYFAVKSQYAIVQNWLSGKLLRESIQTTGLLINLGKTLADIHQSTNKTKFQNNPNKKYVWDAAQFALVKNDFRKVKKLLPKTLVALVNGVFKEWDDKRGNLNLLPQGVCHNDFHGGNLLAKGNDVVGILDFGDALKTWYVADLAITLAFISFKKANPLPSMKSIVRGYSSKRKLSAAEKSSLPLLIKMRAAALAVEVPLETKHRDKDFYQEIYKQSIFILNYFNNQKNLKAFVRIVDKF